MFLHSVEIQRKTDYIPVIYNLLFIVRVSLNTVWVHIKQCNIPALIHSSSVSFLVQVAVEGTWSR